MSRERIWVFGDYKQAESRVVAWRGPVPLLKQFYSKEVDTHVEVAKLIAKVIQEHKIVLPNNLFRRKPWQLLTAEDKEERQIGKNTTHAGNYGIQKNTLSAALKIPPKYAEIILAVYHTIFPEVRRGYQRWIDECLSKTGTVTTPLGRPKAFYDIPSEDRSRKAYAYYAQSTIGDLLTILHNKMCMIFHPHNSLEDVKEVLTPSAIKACGFDVRLNIHDALGISVPNDSITINHVITTLEKESAIPMNIAGDDLIIPMDFKIGPSWGELTDFKRKAV